MKRKHALSIIIIALLGAFYFGLVTGYDMAALTCQEYAESCGIDSECQQADVAIQNINITERGNWPVLNLWLAEDVKLQL